MASPFGTAVSPDSSVKKVTYAQLDDDEFEYSMRNRRRGLVYIINNYKFHSSLPDRNFSCLDRDALLLALRFVGFKHDDIRLRENQTADEMRNLTFQAASENYKKMGSLVFIVLSHGDEEMVYGTDCQSVTYEQLLHPIRKASTHILEGVPKLLLVQACKLSDGLSTHPFRMREPEGPRPIGQLSADDISLEHDAAGFGPLKPFSTSLHSDVVIAYSTVPGTPGGSRFIQAFCEVMRRDGRRLEVTEIFARTSRVMSYTPGTSMPSKSLPSPCVISQLKKGLFFA